jgi:hypothetical protein
MTRQSRDCPPLSSPPRKRGSRADRQPSSDLVGQIFPRWIGLFDEHDLPSSSPFLDAFFAQYRIRHGGMELGVGEPMDAIPLRKAVDYISPVCRDAVAQIACYANVDRPVPLAGENVNAGFHSNFILAWVRAFLDPRFRGGDGEWPALHNRGPSAQGWVVGKYCAASAER